MSSRRDPYRSPFISRRLLADTSAEDYLRELKREYDDPESRLSVRVEPKDKSILHIELLMSRPEPVYGAPPPPEEMVHICVAPDEKGAAVDIVCRKEEGYALYLQVISWSREHCGAYDVDLNGTLQESELRIARGDRALVNLGTSTVEYISWLRDKLQHEIGWIESERIGYYCIRAAIDACDAGYELGIVASWVRFHPWYSPGGGWEAAYEPIASIRLTRLRRDVLQCMYTWNCDCGSVPLLQIVTQSIKQFPAPSFTPSVLDKLHESIQRLQSEEPIKTLTLGLTPTAGLARRHEATREICSTDSPLWELRDWVLSADLPTDAVAKDRSTIWLRDWECIDLGSSGTESTTSDETYPITNPIAGEPEGCRVEGEWYISGEWAWRNDTLFKPVYWAELRVEQPEEKSVLIAEVYLPTKERLRAVREIRRRCDCEFARGARKPEDRLAASGTQHVEQTSIAREVRRDPKRERSSTATTPSTLQSDPRGRGSSGTERPTLPAGRYHRRRWLQIWLIIEPMVSENRSYAEISEWLKRENPELPSSENTLRKIGQAGLAGLFDDMPSTD